MTLAYLLYVIISAKIVLNILYYIHLWYVKEYRFDRMAIHLKTDQARQLFFPPLKKPPLTPKTLFLFGSSIFLLGLTLIVLSKSLFVAVVLIYLLAFPVVCLFVALTKIPTFLYHEYIISKALAKLRKHKKMLVIGITGSYGKTTTKEFLTTILSTKYNVLKTPESKNSPIAIAETILKSLRQEHEIFVVEMGAYKKGEIARMCEMVKPEIGILTALNEQHQDLFGSMETRITAKYELLAGLSGKKIAIVNADNEYTKQMGLRGQADRLDVWWYTTKEVAEATLSASDIHADTQSISFTLHYKNQKSKTRISVLGEHQVSNVLAATGAALASGMTYAQVIDSFDKITSFNKTMQAISGVNGSIFINDTFNNNPDAAVAAIAYLIKTKGKKILVFQPMIELGEHEQQAHERVGEAAGTVCDSIFLTNTNFKDSFMKGAHRAQGDKKVYTFSAHETALQIKKVVGPGDTVLFKGKEAEAVLRLLR